MNLYKIIGLGIKDQVTGAANGTTAQSIVGNVVKAVLGIAGVIAVVVIIIGGVFYMRRKVIREKLQRPKTVSSVA